MSINSMSSFFWAFHIAYALLEKWTLDDSKTRTLPLKVMLWTLFRNHSSLVSNSVWVFFPARHMTHLRAANVSRRGSAGVRAKCCQVHDEEGMNVVQEVSRKLHVVLLKLFMGKIILQCYFNHVWKASNPPIWEARNQAMFYILA